MNPSRLKLQKLMYQTVQQQKQHGNWHYHEVRPLPVVKIPVANNVATFSDCSFGVKLLCFAAGIQDPTGFGYEGVGNSTSIWEHLPHIDLSQALPGDPVTFGVDGSVHVAMLYMWHDNHCWLWNMGEEGEPAFVTLGSETAYHAGEPVTWCQLLRPDPTPHLKGNPPKKGHP